MLIKFIKSDFKSNYPLIAKDMGKFFNRPAGTIIRSRRVDNDVSSQKYRYKRFKYDYMHIGAWLKHHADIKMAQSFDITQIDDAADMVKNAMETGGEGEYEIVIIKK